MIAQKAFLVLGIALAATGCGSQPTAPAQAPQPGLAVGAPLPPGWVWPFDLARVGAAFSPFVVYRPIDVTSLRAARGSGPCAPVEIAPNVWITPLCEALPNFSAAAHIPARQKSLQPLTVAAVDLRTSGLDGPVKDQGMVGVCWSFAMSTVLENALRRASRPEYIAPLHVLSSKTYEALWKSGTSRDFVTEPEWPYDPVKACKLNESQTEVWCEKAYHVKPGSWRNDPVLVAEVQRADATGSYRIVDRQRISPPTDADAIAGALADGQSVYVSMEIDMNAFRAPAMQAGIIPDYQQGGSYHAMVVAGFRPMGVGRQFLLHNSWGKSWGEEGYGWISEAMVRKFTQDAFVVSGANRSTPLPGGKSQTLPLPFPFPVPGGGGQGSSGCSGGLVRDMIFGNCVKACADGSPPVASVCGGGTPSPGGGAPQSGCPSGQVPDWLTRKCVPQCPNGLPPAGGVCAP